MTIGNSGSSSSGGNSQVDTQGAYVVATVADLVTVPLAVQRVFVSDTLSGGMFSRSTTGTVDSGTVFAGISSTYFKRDIEDIGKFRPEWFGAKMDGVTDDTVAFQAAATLGIVLLQNGSYRIGTVNIPYGIEGVSSKLSIIKPLTSYVNGEKLLIVPTGINYVLRHFMILGTDFQNYNPLWMAHLTAPGASGSSGVNQYEINDVRIYGCNNAWTTDGWIGTIHKLYIAQASVGVRGYRCNNVVWNIELENCVQYFDFYNTASGNEQSSSITFTKLLCESTTVGTNSIASRMSGFNAVTFDHLYIEGLQGENNTIEFGINNICRGITINGYSNAVAVSSTHKKSIKFDNVNGVVLNGYILNSSGNSLNSDHIDTTGLTKNFIDNLVQAYGGRFSKNGVGKHYNYFPNHRFDGGMNCSAALALYGTPILSLDTTEKLTGLSSLKILATSGQGDTGIVYMFQSGSSVVKQLAGKYISMAAWVKIPSTYSLSPTTKPSISMQIYSGQATLYPTYTPSSIIVGEYMLWVTPVAYCDPTLTNIYVKMNSGKSGATADGTEYINVDSVFLVEGDCSNLILNGGLQDSPLMDLYVEGDRTIFKYLSPAASVEPYVRTGDKYHYGSGVTTYIGKVASANAQAFASWKNFGATV
jgi:hypothetical protein